MKNVFLRTGYNYDMNQAGDESALECQDATLAKQSFAEEVDINTIVRRFNITGELPTNVRMPSYGDFSGVFDFHTAMNAVAQANESFDAMPAEVRARFHNNPDEFVNFCANPENLEEARKLGLVPAQEIAQAASLAGPATPLATPAQYAPAAPQTPLKAASIPEGDGGIRPQQ